MTTDSHTPCIVGVGSHTWHPADTGDAGAPEPLAMWETVVRAAEADSGASLLPRLDAVEVVYCQTWQYDDPVGRLVERLGIAPRRRFYSGIGGTTPQVLVQDTAARIARGELDLAVVVGAEALDTQRRYKKRGERYPYSFTGTRSAVSGTRTRSSPTSARSSRGRRRSTRPRSRTTCSRRG